MTELGSSIGSRCEGVVHVSHDPSNRAKQASSLIQRSVNVSMFTASCTDQNGL